MAFLYERGVHAIDKITGFKGVIAARSDSLTGCNRYYLQPPADKDGKHIEGGWYDEHSLDIDTTKQQLVLTRTAAQAPG
jgi:hypothetical protein